MAISRKLINLLNESKMDGYSQIGQAVVLDTGTSLSKVLSGIPTHLVFSSKVFT